MGNMRKKKKKTLTKKGGEGSRETANIREGSANRGEWGGADRNGVRRTTGESDVTTPYENAELGKERKPPNKN